MSDAAAADPAGTEAASVDADPRRRLAAALRPLITLTVSGVIDDEAVAQAADIIEGINARMAENASPGRVPRLQPDASRPPQEFFPTSPITGMINPLAPPLLVRVVDGVDGGYRQIEAEANFDYPYEGPPTCVHGGVIAETFDEVLGSANMVAGNPAMTGTLTVRYRQPTPLHTDLRIVARCTGRDGRKIHAWAGMYHGDVMTAEAEGIFIEVAPSRFVAIAEGNAEGSDPATLEVMRSEAARDGAASDVPGSLGVEGTPPT